MTFQLTVGDVVLRLRREDPARELPQGFGEAKSWRGSYEQVAFEPAELVTIGSMLAHAKSAIGSTIHGYKGGEYKVYPGTMCNIAKWGNCGDDDELTDKRLELMLAPEPTAEPPVPLGAGERHTPEHELVFHSDDGTLETLYGLCRCGWKQYACALEGHSVTAVQLAHEIHTLRTLLDESRAALAKAEKGLKQIQGENNQIMHDLQATSATCGWMREQNGEYRNKITALQGDLARLTAERDAVILDAIKFRDALREEHMSKEKELSAAHAAGRREALLEARNRLCKLCRDGTALEGDRHQFTYDGRQRWVYCSAEAINSLLSEAP